MKKTAAALALVALMPSVCFGAEDGMEVTSLDMEGAAAGDVWDHAVRRAAHLPSIGHVWPSLYV